MKYDLNFRLDQIGLSLSMLLALALINCGSTENENNVQLENEAVLQMVEVVKPTIRSFTSNMLFT